MNVDVHCHIDQFTIEEQKHELKKSRVIGVASNYASGEKLLRLREQFPDELKVCLGIHPEHPDFFYEYELVEQQIRANREKICGIGEIGLPYFNLFNIKESEKTAMLKNAERLFEKFVILAAELDLPVNLHCIEDSLPKGIAVLKKYRVKKALFHWFEGNEQSAREIKDSGWHISVSPDIIANSDYQSCIAKIAPHIRENFTLESDGPWEYDGRRGMPFMTEDTAQVLAEILRITKAETMEIARRNAEKLFG